MSLSDCCGVLGRLAALAISELLVQHFMQDLDTAIGIGIILKAKMA